MERAKAVWHPVLVQAGDDLKLNETAVLKRMVSAAQGDYILFVNMDTLPHRDDGKEPAWLQEVFTLLQLQDIYFFFSNCGVCFAEDKIGLDGKYYFTQRFSNNFGLLAKHLWTRSIDRHPVETIRDPSGVRFHSEWAIEEEVRLSGKFGLRRVESMQWRAFHVHQWGDRLYKTREMFHRGIGIKRYLNKVHSMDTHPWDYYYNYPKPPLLNRLRIWAGRRRREVVVYLKGA